ncbi:MAG: TIGR02996 domain-containing protein [Fimbriiglobus sp.]|nr:TIGR02996 domain-containing protein [Fimbriiglobus sp.]
MIPAPPELVALLAACRARPADDLPRLVLADWLEENGQPERAEFVRIQVEVSHPSADVERIRALKKREADLLAEHETVWTGGYVAAATRMTPLFRRRQGDGGFAPIPPPHRFVRGLLRIGNASEFVDRPELREWLRSPELHWVEQVDFDFSSVEWFVKADLPDELHGRIGLSLRVGGPSGESKWQSWFRQLAISGNFTAARSLHVNGASAEVVLEELTKADVSHLVALTLQGLGNPRCAGLIASAPFIHLSTLDLGPIPEAGIRALAASPHLGNLTHLNLVGSPIGDAGMAALCRSRLGETLRRVEFPNTQITDAGVKAMVNSPLFAIMHGSRLNLNMNRIGDEGLKALTESEYLLRFREIAFRSGEEQHQQNHISDDGIEALAASPYAANLQFLDFWRNRITDRGALALARSPYLNKVLDLSVKENAVTTAGAAALHERFGEKAKV